MAPLSNTMPNCILKEFGKIVKITDNYSLSINSNN